METSTARQLHHDEVEQLLQAGLFAKAPRLEKFFRYICGCYFEGAADQIKEYSIATEALGRPADFDPKKDSIVRVEAHRLRKRLDDYYRGPGATHIVSISIPNGQYCPCFTVRQISDEVAPNLKADSGQRLILTQPQPVALALQASLPVPVLALAKPRTKWPLSVILGFIVLAALALAFLRHRVRSTVNASPTANEVWVNPPGGFTVPVELRILAGYHGPSITDRQQHAWMADAFYNGGISLPLSTDRLGTDATGGELVRSQRSGTFRYDIPLRQACYELHLYLMETEYGQGNPKGGAESSRLFQISINGKSALTSFDPLAEASGPNRLYERVFKDITPANDGKLHLAFSPETGPAFLNAIELLPSRPGRMRPIRIVAQDNPATDSEGYLWSADKYFSGGYTVNRTRPVLNSPEPIYEGERYGNFSYRIPLAPGKYRLTLHFAETWFGTPEAGWPALDSRIFNVFANGVSLLRNYQIVHDTGKPNLSVAKTFDGLEPNAQGMLVVDFVPVKNYAEVNAIEVQETE